MYLNRIDFHCTSITARNKLYIQASIRLIKVDTVLKVNDQIKIDGVVYTIAEVINTSKAGFINLKLL